MFSMTKFQSVVFYKPNCNQFKDNKQIKKT